MIYADQTVWHNSNPENYRQHRKSIHELLYAGYHYSDPVVSYLQPSPGGWTLMAVSTAQSGWNLAGMYITGMRGYDPWLGRFLSPDPLSSPFWNSYHYGHNNPMTFKDPTGLIAVPIIADYFLDGALGDAARKFFVDATNSTTESVTDVIGKNPAASFVNGGVRMIGNSLATIWGNMGNPIGVASEIADGVEANIRTRVTSFTAGRLSDAQVLFAATALGVTDALGATSVGETISGVDTTTGRELTVDERVERAGQVFTSFFLMRVGRGPRSHCFLSGTLVHTESGLVPIESVGKGDLVWAVDSDSGEWSLCPVVEPLVNDYCGDIVSVTVGSDTIESTGGHPYLILAGEDLASRPCVEELYGIEACFLGRWVEARHIRIGDVVLLRSGEQVRVAALSSRQSKLKVYNLHVAGLHTYAVGKQGVAVHNTCATHMHHMIPKQILKTLPRELYKAVRGKRGAPNRWRVPAELHKDIHRGAVNGIKYNDRWFQELKRLGKGELTPERIFEIRDALADDYGLGGYRP